MASVWWFCIKQTDKLMMRWSDGCSLRLPHVSRLSGSVPTDCLWVLTEHCSVQKLVTGNIFLKKKTSTRLKCEWHDMDPTLCTLSTNINLGPTPQGKWIVTPRETTGGCYVTDMANEYVVILITTMLVSSKCTLLILLHAKNGFNIPRISLFIQVFLKRTDVTSRSHIAPPYPH